MPVQVIHAEVDFEVEYYNLPAGNGNTQTNGLSRFNEVRGEFFRPFELSKPPLLRVAVIEKHHTDPTAGERFILVDMHHIITDGTSQEILTREFFELYTGKTLPPLKLQYKDYAEWQSSAKHKELMKQQEEIWLKLFSGELPVLNLPTDFPRPEVQRFEGSRLSFRLNNEECEDLKERAKENGATLYMTILAIFTILLSKLGGQEDVIVGTPT
ncbi:MAG: hypothetical protein GY765_17075, partial [bacterium]|nr:hypothetical protein [bacterium]